MGQQVTVTTARQTAEKAANTAPTQANLKQASLNNQLEIKLGELKLIIAQIQAAGGLTDINAAAALAALSAAI